MARNNFPWSSSRKVQSEESFNMQERNQKQDQNEEKKITFLPSSSSTRRRVRMQAISVSKIRAVLTSFSINRHPILGPRVVGTLFGHRKGHVKLMFQRDNSTPPVFFIEITTQITHLVNEMAAGLVRIALECDKQRGTSSSNNNNSNSGDHDERGKMVKRKRLLEESQWRAYCNGKQCGVALKKEIGAMEAKILKTIEPISMGAGVLPGFNGSGSCVDGELMYMRAKFERVVGSRDSEAFYMMNPDCEGAPELSLYLLRV